MSHFLYLSNSTFFRFTSIGSGKVDIPAVKSGVKEVKTILQAIWEQYSTLNAEGIKRAGEILGKDISEMVKSKLDKEFNGFESNGPKSHPFADIIKQKIQGVSIYFNMSYPY